MHVVTFASELAAGILQLLIFSLVPFVWWTVSARGEGSFLTYMGLKGVSTKNKWRLWLLVAMTFVAFAAASLFALHLLGNVATAVSAFAGQGASAVPAILSDAVVARGKRAGRYSRAGASMLQRTSWRASSARSMHDRPCCGDRQLLLRSGALWPVA